LQISSLSITPIRQPQNRGQDVSDREQKKNVGETNAAQLSGAYEGAQAAKISVSQSQQASPVESERRRSDVFSRNQSEDSDLPFASRKALQTFLQNTANIPQQLGVELAGIDTFV
jgi:hypothetical protein